MHKEIDFENEIEHALTNAGGYAKGDPNGYGPERAMFPAEMVSFVQATQPKFWERLVSLNKDKAASVLVDTRRVHVDDDVELKYYRLQKISEGAIDLKVGEAEPLYGPTEVGTGQADEEVQLSTLVGKLNERFGTQFTLADQLFFDQVRETAVANEQLRQAVMANTIENFEPVFNKQLENMFVERMDGNEEIFVRLMNDEAFRNIAATHLMKAVYQQIKNQDVSVTGITIS